MSQIHDENSDSELYIGLMCGTSIDGVDVALVKIDQARCELVEHYLHPITAPIKDSLRQLCSLADNESNLKSLENRIELMGKLDVQMGHVFAASVNQFLSIKNIPKEKIKAIGSHGQTIRHQPKLEFPFTLQIGDPNIIALETGIQTVADFRRMDIAAGGQGAPLAPAFHNAVMRSTEENRIILNLGGIANITYLPKESESDVIGFDTGTANTLMDAWFMKQHPARVDDFDRDSGFAQKGEVDQSLLTHCLNDPYFELAPPKSTGREYFSIDWLEEKITTSDSNASPADVQKTLLEFSAITIAKAIQDLSLDAFNVYTCGGGTHNRLLIERIEHHLKQTIFASDKIGISGDYLEAMTFAWLARQRLHLQSGNLPSVTGASSEKILGALYLP
ncbi:anhydro-N-acetylmuramic acid kinase [Aliikangiella marina]|uniref:Anhydro-N-acetylmuramic acid kinase n=1 Tax=Aliikangiella marina TaxID=1712262 RepID=A0A545TAA0_9GAMM|nr:anhydro-N-acetylmuramic acid kinase [Aliikangiella marina]TQV74127.1 anhydro-N-acetylmuramic acid kinase [Aliikangiella marina]